MRRSLLSLALLLPGLAPAAGRAEPLPDTQPLERKGDLAALMVEGIDRYLMRELAASVEKRQAYWKPDLSSPEAYAKSVQPNREHLKKMLGVVDARVPFTGFDLVGTTDRPALRGQTDKFKVIAVRWPVLPGVDGEGLLLEPTGKVVAQVVALPDADWSPESFAGLPPGRLLAPAVAGRLAENGCRVVVPVLIDRRDTWSGNPRIGRMTNQPHREFVYRQAYEMGRHVIGYEVQKVLAAVDGLCRDKVHPPVGVFGCGEGGLLALYSAALDDRIEAAAVAGYFGPREGLWQEPIYRNVFGLLREFGDAEVARLVLPRPLIVEHSPAPLVAGPPPPHDGRGGAAPGRIVGPTFEPTRAEVERAALRLGGQRAAPKLLANREAGGDDTLRAFLAALARVKALGPPASDFERHGAEYDDADARQKRQLDQLVNFTQAVMRDAERVRAANFWARLNTSSVEKYRASCEPFRRQLAEEIIGKLPDFTEAPQPRTRQVYDEPKWKGYEVTLDLYPDVFACGILLVPKDLRRGEWRPVVVCQHGLEGRPTDVVNPKERTRYYNSFGAQLADRGYVVYAPQNPYIGQDRFRVLQRKANPLGLSLFSFIVRQHERTLDWLATLPYVDPERLAFYGLSYGGKTAMRVPALLPRYCLSICSGDFNEWTWKNASVDFPGSYMFSGEYEMPEFNLGSTLVYAEMAALIAPRPFMVERGHDDGVGIDGWVAYEYAKVRRLYSRIRLPGLTEIEFFAGGHEVHGVGTFAFLQKHLQWPR
jgi:dienelactone hydrolase